MVSPTYSREALLEWVRHNAPDLRVGHAYVDGRLEYYARFTWNGEVFELEATGDDPANEIAALAADSLHEAMGRGPLTKKSETDDLPQRIVAAHLAGDEASVRDLTTRMVTTRAQRARPLQAQTNFTKAKVREIW